jgi:hypothetical protein
MSATSRITDGLISSQGTNDGKRRALCGHVLVTDMGDSEMEWARASPTGTRPFLQASEAIRALVASSVSS